MIDNYKNKIVVAVVVWENTCTSEGHGGTVASQQQQQQHTKVVGLILTRSFFSIIINNIT